MRTRSDAARRGPDLLFLLLNAACFLALGRRAPEAVVDTVSYVDHAIHRTPGYPLFLDLARLLGGDHGFKVAQLLQLAVGIAGAAHLSLTLRDCFRVPRALFLALHLVFLFPQSRFASHIVTESLSHGLFFLLLSFATRSFFRRGAGPILGVALCLAALLLLRPQFLFLVPLLPPYAAWLLYTRRGELRRLLLPVLALGLALPATLLAQSAYNYAYSGRFARIPFTGVQTATVALFLSEPGDAARLPEGPLRRYFELASRPLEEGRWRAQHRPPFFSYFEHFAQHYNDIYLRAVVPAYQQLTGRDTLAADDWVALDRLTLDLTARLLRRHGPQLAFHGLKQLQEAGGYLPLFMLALVILPGVLYLRSAYAGALAAAAVGLMGFSNYFLVALVEPLGTRYTMYTEQVQLPFALCLCVYLARYGAPPRGVEAALPPRSGSGRDLGEAPSP